MIRRPPSSTLSLHDALPISHVGARVEDPGRERPLALWEPLRDGLHGGREDRSEEHTSELQSHSDLVCRLLLEKKKKKKNRQVPLNIERHQDRKSTVTL